MKNSLPSEVDQLPPHAEEAERSALGCVLLSESALADLQDYQEPVSLFYDVRHRLIVEAMLDLANAGRPVDSTTLVSRLKAGSKLEEAGGFDYLPTLVNYTPSAANLRYYLDILQEHRQKRALISAGLEIVDSARTKAISEAVAHAESLVFTIAHGASQTSETSTKSAVLRFVNRIEAAVAGKPVDRGLTTGIHKLDQIIKGMKAGQLIVVAARPSQGKTALACQIADHVAIDLKLPVGFWSLEMTGDELIERFTATRAKIPLTYLRDGVLTEGEVPRLTCATSLIASSHLHIHDRPGLSIAIVRSMARRASRKHGLKLIVVDYLGLLHGCERRKDRRDLELGEITSQLKECAKELGVPVVLLSQLNRESERDNREPRLSDLRDSGSIEQDADVVVLIHHDRKGDDPPGEMQPAKLLVKKNRNGRTGCVDVNFNGPLMRFDERP